MHPYFQVGRIPDNPSKSRPAIRKARMQNEVYGCFFLDLFFFSRNTKPIEYYSVAAIRAVFNLIRRIRRVHDGEGEMNA